MNETNNAVIDTRFYLDMFITTDIAIKFEEQSPYAKCNNIGCKKGVMFDGYCPICTKPFLLKEILNVPDRYKIPFTCNNLKQNIENLIKNKFIILTGSDFYIKLIAFYIANKIVDKNKMVYYIQTKRSIDYNNMSELSERVSLDFMAMKFADLLLFDDVSGQLSDVNYKTFLKQRMDNNLPVIFFNHPDIINLKDVKGNLLPDIIEFLVDMMDIKI